MKKVLFLLFAVSVLMISCKTEQKTATGKASFKLKFDTGDVFKYSTNIEQEMEMDMMGQKQNLTQTIGMDYEHKVVGVSADGIIDMKITYQAVRMKQSIGGMTTNFDSDKDDMASASPQTKGFAMLVGNSFNVSYNPDGSVANVAGVDDMLNRMIEKLDVGVEADAMKEQLKSQYGDESLKQTMGAITNFYPGKEVKIGDSWNRDYSMEYGMSMNLKNKFTLTDRSDGKAFIDLVSEIAPGKASGGGAFTIEELKGKQKGSMIVDEETGWPIESIIEQDMKGTMKSTGRSVEMNIKGTVTNRLIK